jgi:hypothetical protein
VGAFTTFNGSTMFSNRGKSPTNGTRPSSSARGRYITSDDEYESVPGGSDEEHEGYDGFVLDAAVGSEAEGPEDTNDEADSEGDDDVGAGDGQPVGRLPSKGEVLSIMAAAPTGRFKDHVHAIQHRTGMKSVSI